jgi:hypothetical protein
MGTSDTPERWTLYELPCAAKLALAAFLISAGLGYFSALVNLHFQEATPGKALPDEDDVVRSYTGKDKASQLERLLTAHPSLPFNGDGSMRRVFMPPKVKATEKSLKLVAARMGLDLQKNPKLLDDPKVREKVRERFFEEIDGERVALISWLHRPEAEMKEAYEKDALKRDEKLKSVHVNPKVVNDDDCVQVKSIIENRCVGCHTGTGVGAGAQFPLNDWDEISVYTKPERKGKSLPKLALTTHVHLLGFSMLYGLTGLLLALTPLPGWIRVPLAPAALVAQVIDIAFWWLARMDEPHGALFARGIPITGGVVALSLGLQILLTLFSMFGRVGKIVLVVVIAAVIGGGFGVGLKPKIEAYLADERGEKTMSEEDRKRQDDARKQADEARKKEEADKKKEVEDKKKDNAEKDKAEKEKK